MADSGGFRIINMFNTGSRPTTTESVVELADSVVELSDSVVESANSTADSSSDLEWACGYGP